MKTKAIYSGIWDLVDPANEIEPEHLDFPIAPSYVVPTHPTQTDRDALELFKIQTEGYKIRLEQYDRQQKAFGELVDFIHDTIAPQYFILIQYESPSPWSILRALKAGLALPDYSKPFEIEAQYQRLLQGPSHRDMEDWLEEFQRVYIHAEVYGMRDIVHRAQQDFFRTVIEHQSEYPEAYIYTLQVGKEIPEMHDMIRQLRQEIYIRRIIKT